MISAPVPLAPLETDVLWMASQGFNAARIAREHAISTGGVTNIYLRVAHKLGTHNITHSVAFALTHGLIGPYRDCGDRRAYLRHLRRKETACVACRIANTTYVTAQTNAPFPESVGLTPTQVKIIRYLDAHDCSLAEAADEMDMDRRRVASHMAQAYQRMGIAHLPREDRRPALLKTARSRGYLE